MRFVTMASVLFGACGLQEWDALVDTGERPLVDCGAVPPEDCATTIGCIQIRGRPLRDSSRGLCYDADVPLETLGCRQENMDCGFALTFALDETKQFWWFPDECLPPEFDAFLAQGPGDCDP